MIRGVLLVCVGNLCRSPMAEGLLAQAMPSLRVASAGLSAPPGALADPYAIQVMAARGLDLSAHRSRSLTADLCADFDLILCMNQRQRRAIASRHATAAGKTFALGATAIADPYGQGFDAFAACLADIDSSLRVWTTRLRALENRHTETVS